MIIYSVEYTLKSPLLISKPEVGNVIRNSYEYLPGSTIRGAMLKELLDRGIQHIKEESRNPTIIFHQAFPLDDNNRTYKPSHPFIYECKICKSIKKVNPYDICSYDDIKPQLFCEKGHPYTLKSLGGKLLIESNGKVLKYKPRYTILESVGINRITGSSEINLLYSYVALEPYMRFKGLIVVNNDKIDLKNEFNNDSIFIGKGISRGFGEVNVRFEEINYDKKRDELYKLINNKEQKVILKALSPLFNITYNDNGLITTNVFNFENLKNFGSLKSTLTISTGSTKVSGFSLISNTQKIELNALKEGSLLYFTSSNIKNHIDLLMDIELNGIGLFACSGFNIVEVI